MNSIIYLEQQNEVSFKLDQDHLARVHQWIKTNGRHMLILKNDPKRRIDPSRTDEYLHRQVPFTTVVRRRGSYTRPNMESVVWEGDEWRFTMLVNMETGRADWNYALWGDPKAFWEAWVVMRLLVA